MDFPGLKTVWCAKTDKYPRLCCATRDGAVDALMAEREHRGDHDDEGEVTP
jgi:hypothetical protein